MTLDLDALRKEEFPWAHSGETIYLNNASTGPLPQRTVSVLDEWTRLRANPSRVEQDLQFDTLARARSLIAQMIGAETGEIALATGFGSLSNFNRQFRTLKQTTPLRYRRSTAVRDAIRG